MSHIESNRRERTGVRPPEHLVDWTRRSLADIGETELAARVGVARATLLRVAAAQPVYRGTIALIANDYAAHGPRRAA